MHASASSTQTDADASYDSVGQDEEESCQGKSTPVKELKTSPLGA